MYSLPGITRGLEFAFIPVSIAVLCSKKPPRVLRYPRCVKTMQFHLQEKLTFPCGECKRSAPYLEVYSTTLFLGGCPPPECHILDTLPPFG